MKVRTVESTSVRGRGRLDASFFLSPGVARRDELREALEEGRISTLSEVDSLIGADSEVWQPSRFKRAYARPGAQTIPYLKPYDVFDYLPRSATHLSIAQTENLGSYRTASGTLLQTCSGRNLGPLSVADEYLERFALSHDILRVDGPVEVTALLYAFLGTSHGQAMLRQRMSGSVIDHLTVDDVKSIEVPRLGDHAENDIVGRAKFSMKELATARVELQALLTEYDQALPDAQESEAVRNGWTVKSQNLVGRIDAAFYAPGADAARDAAVSAGGGSVLDVAHAILPGRYKRYYTEPGYGTPIMSSTHLLQFEPINLRWIADRSFSDPAKMVVTEGMVCFGADGRWEGRLGWPAYITSERDGWMASNHVLRLNPKDASNVGALWLAMACQHTQVQLNALPCGSVVDSVTPTVLRDLVIPPLDIDRGAKVVTAWERFVNAREATDEARSILEDAIAP